MRKKSGENQKKKKKKGLKKKKKKTKKQTSGIGLRSFISCAKETSQKGMLFFE
jgi:hypothetical protein